MTLTCSAAIDQEDELRGYHRTAIDFTLHTIVEESCEESEVEQNVTKKKERPVSATDLEKYFFFGLGNGIIPTSNKEDAFSETSSIYSEGIFKRSTYKLYCKIMVKTQFPILDNLGLVVENL